MLDEIRVVKNGEEDSSSLRETASENQDPDLKEENKQGDNLSKVAVIFGQTEEEMNREFREFKAGKLFRKFVCDLYSVTEKKVLESKIEEAVNFDFGEIFVCPSLLKFSLEVIKNRPIALSTAVCYPFGEEFKGIKKQSAKRAIAMGAKIISVPCSTAKIKNGEFDEIKQEYKKIVRLNKKIEVRAIIETSLLTSEETEKAIKVLSSSGVKNFVCETGYVKAFGDTDRLKLLRSAVNRENKLFSYSSAKCGSDIIRLLTVSDRIIVKNPLDIALDLKANLKY